jgi:hypothetical protein
MAHLDVKTLQQFQCLLLSQPAGLQVGLVGGPRQLIQPADGKGRLVILNLGGDEDELHRLQGLVEGARRVSRDTAADPSDACQFLAADRLGLCSRQSLRLLCISLGKTNHPSTGNRRCLVKVHLLLAACCLPLLLCLSCIPRQSLSQDTLMVQQHVADASDFGGDKGGHLVNRVGNLGRPRFDGSTGLQVGVHRKPPTGCIL